MTIEINDYAIIADPCYSMYMGLLKIPMKSGKYRVGCTAKHYGSGCTYVSKLWVMHESVQSYLELTEEGDKKYRPAILTKDDVKESIGVDSGQAGIFDYSYFASKHDKMLDPEWYFRVCNRTSGDDGKLPWGTIDNRGVVSSSGIGDGGYECHFAFNSEGERVFAEIDYEIEDIIGEYGAVFADEFEEDNQTEKNDIALELDDLSDYDDDCMDDEDNSEDEVEESEEDRRLKEEFRELIREMRAYDEATQQAHMEFIKKQNKSIDDIIRDSSY